MNSTARGLNRLLLAVVAIVLLAAGAVSVALVAVPGFAGAWAAQVRSALRGAPAWAGSPLVGPVSALGVGIAAVALVLALLLLAFIARQGGGRTTRVAEEHRDAGTTLVDLGVPRRLLEEELTDRPEFVAVRVSAYRVRRTPALKVSVQCRRGVAPSTASSAVTDALEGLDEILGTSIPALVQVSGGFRSRLAGRARLT